MAFLFSTGAVAREGLRTAAPRRDDQAPLFEALFMRSFIEMRARDNAPHRDEPRVVNS